MNTFATRETYKGFHIKSSCGKYVQVIDIENNRHSDVMSSKAEAKRAINAYLAGQYDEIWYTK